MASIFNFADLEKEVANLKKEKASFSVVNKNAALAENKKEGVPFDVVLSDNFSIVKGKPNAFTAVEKDELGNEKPEIAIFGYSTEGHRFRIDTFIMERIKPGDTITLVKGIVPVSATNSREIPFFTFMDVKVSSSTTKAAEEKPATEQEKPAAEGEKPADSVNSETV